MIGNNIRLSLTPLEYAILRFLLLESGKPEMLHRGDAAAYTRLIGKLYMYNPRYIWWEDGMVKR